MNLTTNGTNKIKITGNVEFSSITNAKPTPYGPAYTITIKNPIFKNASLECKAALLKRSYTIKDTGETAMTFNLHETTKSGKANEIMFIDGVTGDHFKADKELERNQLVGICLEVYVTENELAKKYDSVAYMLRAIYLDNFATTKFYNTEVNYSEFNEF
jgi:hypothetical protein